MPILLFGGKPSYTDAFFTQTFVMSAISGMLLKLMGFLPILSKTYYEQRGSGVVVITTADILSV